MELEKNSKFKIYLVISIFIMIILLVILYGYIVYDIKKKTGKYISNLFFFFNMTSDNHFMQEAIVEAEKSLAEGGLPIGAVLVRDGEIISRGHNRLIQNDSVILHAEMDASYTLIEAHDIIDRIERKRFHW